MVNMNVFRILGDVSHTVSKIILIWAIHSNRSAEGVSLITQALYGTVFIARYLDLFWVPPNKNKWNFVLKNVYIISSVYTIFLMMRVYARTREREKAWKFGALCLAGSTLAAPFVMMLLSVKEWSFTENLWTFSVILESVCVLPQLLLLRQTTVPTVIDSFYLVTLGSYRAFYILNWILRAKHEIPRHMDFDFIAPIFGVIQTAFYIDFAWVYYARQRVKLRNGGIIDSEDLSRGWLVGKVMGRGVPELDEEDPLTVDGSNNGGLGRAQVKWAVPRGISVSADEELFQPRQKRRTRTHPATVIRGNEDAAMLEGNSEAEDSSDSITPPNGQQNTSIHDVGNGEEWRNESNK